MLNFIELQYIKESSSQPDIFGIDEVGRGCLAGPIVAGCVKWNWEFILSELNNIESQHRNFIIDIKDSKKLSHKKREILSNWILENAEYTNIISISAEEIDSIGIQKANKVAMASSLPNRGRPSSRADHIYVLTDYMNIDKEIIEQGRGVLKSIPILHGEDNSLSIASSSIIAKVYRDNLMRNEMHPKYAKYGFDTNVGYGTKKHIEAIKKYGLVDLHRKSFTSRLVSGIKKQSVPTLAKSGPYKVQ